MPEELLANEPEARTPTGELKDQQTPVTEGKESKVETKPADDKSLLNKDKDAPTGAPEKYEAFTVPEGFTLDEAAATEAGTLFKTLNLTQEQAQSLVDFHSAKIKAATEAPIDTYTKMREEWQTATKADPVIGSKLPEVKATVSRALDSLGDPALAKDFRAAMDLTGAGDHPAFIKAFYKLAQMVNEGKPVAAAAPSKFGQTRPGDAPTSAAKALYPNLA